MDAKRQLLRKLLWLYFFLVIFEGALRKWVVPGMATPLLVVRDPVCIMALFLGFPYLLKQAWVWGFVLVGIIAVPMAVAFGHGSMPVAIYGARILLLHFPMIFLFAAVFDRDDVCSFAKVTMLILIPMTVLLAAQFYLPPTHFVNVGIGGEGTSVFDGVAGRHRSSGTFTFTNGLAAFYGLSAALGAAWLVRGARSVPLWFWVSAGCLVLALPLSISRTIAFHYALTILFVFIAVGFSPKLLKTIIPATVGLLLVGLFASQTQIFQGSMEAFSQRWEAASRVEGGDDGVAGVIESRVLGYGMIEPLQKLDQYPLMGMGIGLGTNVGARLMTGERAFLVSEGGWGAVLGELGPVLGLLLLGFRAIFALSMGVQALSANRLGNPMPLIIGSMAINAMFMGNTSQPTALGFIILSCGLMLAAFNDPPEDEAELEEEEEITNA